MSGRIPAVGHGALEWPPGPSMAWLPHSPRTTS